MTPGQVISQDPEEGAAVAAGTAVNIVISEKQQETQAPDNSGNDGQQGTTQTPQQNNQMKRKTLTIKIPDDAGETVKVIVLANGKEIWNTEHQKSEGKIDITVQSDKDAEVQVYMDDKLVVHKMIEFD